MTCVFVWGRDQERRGRLHSSDLVDDGPMFCSKARKLELSTSCTRRLYSNDDVEAVMIIGAPLRIKPIINRRCLVWNDSYGGGDPGLPAA